MTTAKAALFVAAGAAAGILVGLWMASMTYYCEFCLFGPPRFAIWQSCLIGFLPLAVVLSALIVVYREFFHAFLRGLRIVSRFLFEDLTPRPTD